MTIFYVALAVLMFGIMITVHELGHFVAARLTRIPVRAFAVGFGPALVKWTSKKHETEFAIRAIPMGGYCAFMARMILTGSIRTTRATLASTQCGAKFITVLMGAVRPGAGVFGGVFVLCGPVSGVLRAHIPRALCPSARAAPVNWRACSTIALPGSMTLPLRITEPCHCHPGRSGCLPNEGRCRARRGRCLDPT